MFFRVYVEHNSLNMYSERSVLDKGCRVKQEHNLLRQILWSEIWVHGFWKYFIMENTTDSAWKWIMGRRIQIAHFIDTLQSFVCHSHMTARLHVTWYVAMTALLFLICAQYRISLFAPSTHLLALDVVPTAIFYTVWCQFLLMPPSIY